MLNAQNGAAMVAGLDLVMKAAMQTAVDTEDVAMTAADDDCDDDSIEGSHLKQYKPAQPRNKRKGWPRRSQKEIRATLTQNCPDAPARVDALLGPFANFHEMARACRAWSRNPALQPEGTFNMSLGSHAMQSKSRGALRTVQCTNWKALKCGCKLVYEHALDENYYLRDASIDDHGATCRIISPEKAAEDMAMDLDSAEGSHLKQYKPAPVRNEGERFRWRRSQKEIRATLMQKCPDAPARVDALLGPFATPREIIQACKAWSWHPALQPEGVFDMSYGNLQKPGKRVGEQRTVQCTNWKALKCGCKLVYEHAIDENYYLRNANLDDHGATCRIISPEKAAENMATAHLRRYKPASVRNEVGRPRRSQKEIRATLMQKCPDAPARVDALLGPFATPREIIQACKAWSWHPALQPEGVFDMSYGNLQKPGKRVGEQRTVQCTNWKALKCGCKLVYEHAIDENYYLRNANLDDHGATCRIIRPESATENTVCGKNEIPEHFFSYAKQLKRDGLGITAIHTALCEKAEEESVAVTWKMGGLYYQLDKVFPRERKRVSKWSLAKKSRPESTRRTFTKVEKSKK